jgi:hypothetical protein
VKRGMVKSQGKKQDRCVLFVYIKIAHRKKLEKIAENSCKSLSSLIRDILDNHINESKV